MALSLRYVGARPYTELRISKHSVMGFSRGMVRDDVPENLIRDKIMPMIENGATAWEVIGSDSVQAEKMLDTVEEAPKPAIKEVVKEVVQKVVRPLPAISDEEVDADILLSTTGFTTSMTRAQMMSWCSGNGISVNNRSTKASMTNQARAYVTGASE